ncbi:type 1 fimbrial protein [Escherichia coli]|nr:type 1 fimbrial protein [Escherichia coli]MBB8200489.1 type 1 fimbrial protein [Escherichia coli]HAW1374789.1 type 1 fimbrial protein [Escherichia coli]
MVSGIRPTIPLTNGNNTLHYQAWVKKAGASVIEGEFTTVAGFTLAYN